MSTEQQQIEFGNEHRARIGWEKLLTVCREISEHATAKEMAFRCDVSPSLLSASLAGTTRNYFRAEWLPVFIIAATESQRIELLGCLAGLGGYELAKKKVRTPAEELALLKSRLRHELGSAGERIIAELEG